MGQPVNFHVTGHGQLNGNLRIDKSVQMDSDIANRLRVSKPALLEFVNVHYPGAKISESSLTVRIVPIKKEQDSQKKPSQKKYSLSSGKTQNIIKQGKKETVQIKSKKENRAENHGSKIELQNRELLNKIEKEKLKHELNQVRTNNRNNKIDQVKKAHGRKPKDLFYYLKLAWVYLDTPMKKAIAIFVILWLIGGIYSSLVEFFTK